MNIPEEYRIQSILAPLQIFTVVVGMFAVLGSMKSQGYREGVTELPRILEWVAAYGYGLIALPIVWSVATLWFQRHAENWYSNRWSIVSGFVLLLGLASIFCFSLMVVFSAFSGALIQFS